VDAIVEEENLEIHISAEGVEQVVTADGQGVAVTGGDPDIEIGPGELQARGDRGRAAMDGVKAVGVEVIGKSAGANDTGDEDDVAARDTELGEDLFGLREDGIITATGAPADFLVRGEIGGGAAGAG